MNAEECLGGSETLLPVHITRWVNWWRSLGVMLLLPFKDVEASVSLVLWHLYVFKDLQCPSFRVIQSAENDEQVWELMPMWGCSPVPEQTGRFPPSCLRVTTSSVLLLTESLGHFTKQFLLPIITLPCWLYKSPSIEYPSWKSFLKETLLEDLILCNERNTCHQLFPSSNISASKIFLVSFAL